ncbi:hypothetical protein TNCV_4631081 [Trichonephila clavipes]|nr:hypothetical protein TNCV_4631081 [Trichonephila clavipes]
MHIDLILIYVAREATGDGSRNGQVTRMTFAITLSKLSHHAIGGLIASADLTCDSPSIRWFLSDTRYRTRDSTTSGSM